MVMEPKIFSMIMKRFLYISSHQYPYYPGSGAANDKGNKDNVLNVPLSAGTQSHEFLNAYDSIFKKLKAFKPEFILLSAGFDAHKDDPLAQINLESKDYYTLTKRILSLAKELCDGKVVSILEGGYDLNALKESVDYHVKSLIGIINKKYFSSKDRRQVLAEHILHDFLI